MAHMFRHQARLQALQKRSPATDDGDRGVMSDQSETYRLS